ncbi:MAG: FAD-binding oxidoreductase, partial [Candidatus Promineifilaceae bacterium]
MIRPAHAKLDAFLNDLAGRVAGDVRADQYSRLLYSTDASIYQKLPLAVLIPRSAEDVQAAVESAAGYGLPLLARGSGSSLAGQAVNEALVVDMTRHLDQLLEVNPEERWARVQPGLVLDHLNVALKPFGLAYGPDPASSDRATLGGVVSNNSTGAHSILYGMTADHVLEAKVVLSDGSQAHFRPLEPGELDAHLERGGLEGAIYRGVASLAAQPANQAAIRAGTPRHWR